MARGPSDFLTALAGGISGAAPGVASGIQRSEQAKQAGFQTKRADLELALGLLGQQQRSQAKARADLDKERRRTQKDQRSALEPFFKNVTTVNRLFPEAAQDRSRFSELRRKDIRTPQEEAELVKLRDVRIPEINEITGRIATALQGSLRIKDPDELNDVFDLIQTLQQKTFLDESDFERTITEAIALQPTKVGKNSVKEIATAFAFANKIKVKPVDPEVVEAKPRKKPVPPTAEEFDRLVADRARAISLVPQIALGGPISELRVFAQGLSPEDRAFVLKSAQEFRGLQRIAREEIERQLEANQPQALQLPEQTPEIIGAQEGLLPPGEDMLVGIQKEEAILPAPAVEALGGIEAIQQLAPDAIRPEDRAGLLPAPAPVVAPQPEVLPLPPSKGGIDLTDVQRPEIRQLAQNLAGPGVNEDDLDTIATLLDGIIESEDLINLT